MVYGAIAAQMAILLAAPESWRLYVEAPFATFAAVTVWVISQNPINFYRRMLARVF